MQSRTRSFTLYIKEKLERYTKTDISYLFKGGAILSIGQGIAGVSGFLLTLGLAHFLEPSEYGQYNYILSIAGIVSAFTLSGMDTAVAQVVAKGFDSALLKGFSLKLKWSIPVAGMTFCIGGYYLMQQNSTLGLSLIIISIFTPLLYASSVYTAYFNGKKEFTKISHDNTTRNIIITISILCVAYFTQNVVAIIFTYFFTSTLISMVRYLYLVNGIPKSVAEAKSPNLSIGKHLSLMDAFSNFSTYIDKIIVFQLLGATSLAVYALAMAPIKQLQGISKIARTLVLPKFSARTLPELQATIPRKTFLFFLASFGIMVAYCVGAEFLFTLFFPQYHEALRYSQVLAVGLLFMPFILHSQALTSLNKKRELYLIHITKPFIRIAMLVIFIPPFGLWGAVYAFLAFYIVHFGMVYIVFKRAS